MPEYDRRMHIRGAQTQSLAKLCTVTEMTEMANPSTVVNVPEYDQCMHTCEVKSTSLTELRVVQAPALALRPASAHGFGRQLGHQTGFHVRGTPG